MNNLTPNMIYRVYNKYMGKATFKDWLDHEKNLYQTKKDSGKITTNLKFPQWLNKRYAGLFKQNGIEVSVSAEGKFKAFLKKISEGVKKTGGKIIENYQLQKKAETPEESETKDTSKAQLKQDEKPKPREKQDTIAGLEKPVFYTLVGLGSIAVITMIIVIARSAAKQK